MADSIGKKTGKVVVWILLALLIVGLAGFGIGSFGGSATSIGRVGDREITAQQYLRSLDRAIRAERAATGQAIGRQQAEASGLLAQVQGQLAGEAALDGEAESLGLSVSDETVGVQVLTQPAFQGPTGDFDRQTYEFALRQNGWTVPQYEEELRRETARAILQGAVASAAVPPAVLVDTMMDFFGETRDLAWQTFGPEALPEPLPEPSQADLEAQYAAAPGAYSLPRTKRITYAILRPETLAEGLEPEAGAVEALYQSRIAEFVQPERRLVERLVFPDAASAEAAKSAIDAGDSSFAEVVAERGLDLADIDLGDVERTELGAAADAVFALEIPGIVGPVQTDLGPALFRMNGILNAQDTPLEDVADELAAEVTADRARRMLEDMVPDLDDRLAAGATLEDLAAETEMRLGTLDYYVGVEDDVAAYETVRELADAVEDGDFPTIEILEDGGLFALRLEEIVEPRVQPLPDVRATVAADWRDAELIRQLTEVAERAQAQLAVGGTLGDGGDAVQRAEGLTRDAFVEDGPGGMVPRAFELAEGESAIVAGDGAVTLVVVEGVAPPSGDDPRMELLRQALEAQTAQGLASDLMQYYGQALLNREGLSFEPSGLNAVHTQVFN